MLLHVIFVVSYLLLFYVVFPYDILLLWLLLLLRRVFTYTMFSLLLSLFSLNFLLLGLFFCFILGLRYLSFLFFSRFLNRLFS